MSDYSEGFKKILEICHKVSLPKFEFYTSDECVFHFTSLSGLIKIIETKKLWATDLRYLNDAQEMDYGTSLIREELSAFKSRGMVSVTARNLIDEILTTMDSFRFSAAAACFCKDGDHLGQWRGYADRGVGCSIGFKIGELAGIPKFSIHKVIYNINEQKDAIHKFIEEYVNSYCDIYGNKKDQESVDATYRCIFALEYMCATFKHPSFFEENEYRLINSTTDLLDDMKFRAGKNYIVPYIEIDLNSMKEMGIQYLILGPGSDPILAEEGISRFMKLNGCHNVEITRSTIPYRT